MAILKTIKIGRTLQTSIKYESLRVDIELEAQTEDDTLDSMVQDAEALIRYIANGRSPHNAELESAERILNDARRIKSYTTKREY